MATQPITVFGSETQIEGSETQIEVYRLLPDVGEPGALVAGRLERASGPAQISPFGGGMNEAQREIVGWAGLRMAYQET